MTPRYTKERAIGFVAELSHLVDELAIKHGVFIETKATTHETLKTDKEYPGFTMSINMYPRVRYSPLGGSFLCDEDKIRAQSAQTAFLNRRINRPHTWRSEDYTISFQCPVGDIIRYRERLYYFWGTEDLKDIRYVLQSCVSGKLIDVPTPRAIHKMSGHIWHRETNKNYWYHYDGVTSDEIRACLANASVRDRIRLTDKPIMEAVEAQLTSQK